MKLAIKRRTLKLRLSDSYFTAPILYKHESVDYPVRRIEVTSEPGKGATFTLIFPV